MYGRRRAFLVLVLVVVLFLVARPAYGKSKKKSRKKKKRKRRKSSDRSGDPAVATGGDAGNVGWFASLFGLGGGGGGGGGGDASAAVLADGSLDDATWQAKLAEAYGLHVKAQEVSRRKPTAGDRVDTIEQTRRFVRERRLEALGLYRAASQKALPAARRGSSDGVAVASNALAGCCIETGVLGRHLEAIAYCKRSLAYNPAFMIPQLNLANTLKEEAGAYRRPTAEAVYEYERALAIMGYGCGSFYNGGVPHRAVPGPSRFRRALSHI